MRFFVALLATLFVSLAAVAAEDVAQLTELTFDKETQDHVWFVKFYAPWCGHCKKLAPVFEQLAVDSAITGANVKVAKVDCTKERSVCERFGVQSYPTLKVVAKGRFYDYAGRREIDDMAHFATTGYKDAYAEEVLSKAEFVAARKRAEAEKAELERNSAVVAITTSDFDALVKEGGEPWILKFYAPWCGHCKRLAPTWHRLSQTLKESGSKTRVGKIDCTEHRRVCSRFGVNGYPSLFYVRDGVVYKYQGSRSLNAFVEFVNSGWESADSIGPIPDETFINSLIDGTVEWAAKNTLLAVLAGILVIAVFVAILVALLDYCLGADDVESYRQIPRDLPVPGPATPAADKPKAE
ncbi:hypothetical protein Poli38472_014788 [Pythium oligandrum]|uniref:Thioredoxin domain-containing protein n=1 Tax=Pythium oligandrum TaxID=41045 RepID=A0A8K1CK55_PYTOL|nr:hypothetical protein Poli38472_014788 [Pythium oligandrum]|eukprot:TMW63878.1 hypothetical protein Poli38472_014788 [Pythium oligandrum]